MPNMIKKQHPHHDTTWQYNCGESYRPTRRELAGISRRIRRDKRWDKLADQRLAKYYRRQRVAFRGKIWDPKEIGRELLAWSYSQIRVDQMKRGRLERYEPTIGWYFERWVPGLGRHTRRLVREG